MSHGRPSYLAKLSTERDFNVDFNTGIEKFAQMKSRRFLMNLSKGACFVLLPLHATLQIWQPKPILQCSTLRLLRSG